MSKKSLGLLIVSEKSILLQKIRPAQEAEYWDIFGSFVGENDDPVQTARTIVDTYFPGRQSLPDPEKFGEVEYAIHKPNVTVILNSVFYRLKISSSELQLHQDGELKGWKTLEEVSGDIRTLAMKPVCRVALTAKSHRQSRTNSNRRLPNSRNTKPGCRIMLPIRTFNNYYSLA